MIKSVKVTPLYEEWENLEKNLSLKPIIGYDICIKCGINDAGEIFNLVKKMADRRVPIVPVEDLVKVMYITPWYEKWENLGFMRATELDICIRCGIKNVDEILDLVEEMADRRYFIESGEEKDDD